MSTPQQQRDLQNYVAKLGRVLNEQGFKIRWRPNGENRDRPYAEDPDDPMLYSPEDAFSTITSDERAFSFLKSKGLIDTGICPQCGASTAGSTYTFTSGFNPNIKYKICKSCYRQGTAMSINPASDRPSSGGCAGVVALFVALISAAAVIAA